MRKILIAIVMMLFTSSMSFAEDYSQINTMSVDKIYENVKAQLGTAPDGFSWDLYRNAISLKPVGWFVHDKVNNINGMISATHAMSPVDFSEKNQFETGFTVGIFTNLKKYAKPEPSKTASIMIGIDLKMHTKEDIKYLSQNQQGDVKAFWLRYRDAPPGKTPIIVHKYYLANDATDNLNYFIFESPEDKWEENWKNYGSVILKHVSFIPVYPSD
jgi:hypothetical protein